VTGIAQKMLTEAIDLWAEGDTASAIRKLEEAIIISPDYYPAQVKLAELHETRGDISQARKQWKTLKKLTRETLWNNYVKDQSAAFEKRH
jgi:Tfp pilus assembly protein PilF